MPPPIPVKSAEALKELTELYVFGFPFGEKLGKEYLRLLQGGYDWRKILDRNGFDVALLPVDWPLASMLKMDPDWRVVQDDTRVILFQRLGRQTARN